MGEEAVSKIERQKTKKEIFASHAKKRTTLHMCHRAVPQKVIRGHTERPSKEEC